MSRFDLQGARPRKATESLLLELYANTLWKNLKLESNSMYVFTYLASKADRDSETMNR